MTIVYRALTIFAVVVLVGCGSDSPTAPSAQQPQQPAQVSGLWAFTGTVTSVSGGECFATAFQALIGERSSGTIQIQQTGASLTATVTDNGTGGSCTYSGTAGATSVALNTTSCTASDAIGARCPNGALRDVRLQTGAFNASLSGGVMSGTVAETYNVIGAGGPVGVLTINGSFTAQRR